MDGIEPMPIPIQTQLKAVTVGRLVPWKRIDGILEAIARIPEVGLVVIGDGPEHSRRERLAESLGVSDRVYFAGACDRKKTLALMVSWNLFVLNSTYEGLPVVATAVGGMPEVVRDGETGVLVRFENRTLYRALVGLVHEQGWRRSLGKIARQWVHERFNAHAMIEQTESILLTVTKQS